jgi:hypothetical protein
MEYAAEVGGGRLTLLPAADAVAPCGGQGCYNGLSALLQRAIGFCYHGAEALLQRSTSIATSDDQLCYHAAARLLQGAANLAARDRRGCYFGAAALLH